MAYMDNVVPLAMHYTDDTWRRLLKEATSTFTFKVDMLGRDSEQYLTDNAYISFEHHNKTYLFNIMTITPDSGSKSIIVYCENLSLELLNETKAPIDVTISRNLLWYLNNDDLLNNAGLTLGINEVSDKTAKIKLESEQTGLARLTSIANNFGAELEFVTELNGDGTLKFMTVNFFKKYDGFSQGIGTYRRDLILEYGRNVDGIKRTIDKTDLYNAITPTGKDGLNITSLEKEEYDENGNLEYYTEKGSPNIFAPQSKARYRAQLLNDTDGWLRRYYSADETSNVNTLYSLALNELKKHAYPAITYEITGFYDLEIGDTVRIVDTSFTPTLIVQARVAEQSICFSDPTKNKTTFGNILALESRVSQDLTGRLKQLVDEATPYRFEIVSDNGLTFKNSEGNTTLTAMVYKGSNVQEVSVDSFEWLIDGVSFGGASKSQLVSASQVSGTAVVRYNAKINDVVIGGLEVTLQDVSDGKRGVDGVGIDESKIEYASSSSGTIAPVADWSEDIPSVSAGKFLWTRTTINYTDEKSDELFSVSKMGEDGERGDDGIIISPTAPNNPEVNQLWQDTSTTPPVIKKWSGTAWVVWLLYAVNMKADSISAISSNFGDMTAGTAKLVRDVDNGTSVKSYGLYMSNLGYLSTGTAVKSGGTFYDDKMAVAHLSNGSLRFSNIDYNSDLEGVQSNGLSSSNNGFIIYSKEEGDNQGSLKIGASGRVDMRSAIDGQTHYYYLGNNGMEIHSDPNNTWTFKNSSVELYGDRTYIDFHYGMVYNDYSMRIINDTPTSLAFMSQAGGYGQLKASAFTVSSSKEFKRNIRDMDDDQLSKLNELSFKKYRRDDGSFQMGLVLDDVMKEPITDSSKTGIDLYSLTSIIGKAVQELSGKVDELEKRLEKYE